MVRPSQAAFTVGVVTPSIFASLTWDWAIKESLFDASNTSILRTGLRFIGLATISLIEDLWRKSGFSVKQ